LKNHLTELVRPNIIVTSANVTQTHKADSVDALPEALSSSDEILLIDSYQRSVQSEPAEESDKFDGRSLRKAKRSVRKEHGIGIGRRVKYFIKDLFIPQDIISQVQKEQNLSKSANEEEYIDAARKHYKELAGDPEKLTKEQIEENYNELVKEFILGITNLPNRNIKKRNMQIKAYAAVIGEMDATMRARLAADMQKIAGSNKELQDVSKILFDNAEYNLTNADALGNVPTKNESIEYYSNTLSSMSKDDTVTSSEVLQKRAEEIVTRLRELQNKPNLTPEEQDELEKLQLEYNNIVLGGMVGLDIALPLNHNVDNDTLNSILTDTHNTANNLGIEGDLFETEIEYLKFNPNLEKEIAKTRGKSYEEIIDKATNGRYTEYKEDPETFHSKHGISLARKQNNYTSNYRQNSSKGTSTRHNLSSSELHTKPLKQYSTRTFNNYEKEVSNPFALTGGTFKLNKEEERIANKTDKTNSRGYASSTCKTAFQNYAEHKNNKTLRTLQNETAMQSGIEEYIEYKKNNRISTIESCIDILNYNQASTTLKKYAIKNFESLDKSLKEIVFNRLNTSGQIEVANTMDIKDLSNIKRFNSSYSKEYIEKRCEEEEKRNPDLARQKSESV